MSYHDFEVLRISPQYTADEWGKLDENREEHWPSAVAMLRDRIEGRFLRHAQQCLKSPDSGFVVLAIDCLLLETLQQFRCGIVDGRGKSEEMVRALIFPWF